MAGPVPGTRRRGKKRRALARFAAAPRPSLLIFLSGSARGAAIGRAARTWHGARIEANRRSVVHDARVADASPRGRSSLEPRIAGAKTARPAGSGAAVIRQAARKRCSCTMGSGCAYGLAKEIMPGLRGVVLFFGQAVSEGLSTFCTFCRGGAPARTPTRERRGDARV